MSNPDEIPPEVVRYDHTTGETTNNPGEVIATPRTLTQAHDSRQEYEDEWEWFCENAPRDAVLTERVEAHVRKLLEIPL